MRTDISKIYLDWLRNTVYDKNGTKAKTHHKLLNQMHNTVFEVSNQKDYSRLEDGIELRFRFVWERFTNYSDYFTNNYIFVKNIPETSCSILEMMIALSFRADETFAKINNEDLTVPFIFWNMVKNLCLIGETDDLYDADNVAYVLERFNKRMYDSNGRGGLFAFPVGSSEDMRNVEIWYQLCWYINQMKNN